MTSDFDPTQQKSPLDHFTSEDYLYLIEAGKDVLDEYQLGILQALYEEDDIATACTRLGINEEWLEQVLMLVVRWVDEGIKPNSPALEPEPEQLLNQNGKPKLRRLANIALLQTARESKDLNDEEAALLRAAAIYPNQALAAASVGMSLKDFSKTFLKIRRTHGF